MSKKEQARQKVHACASMRRLPSRQHPGSPGITRLLCFKRRCTLRFSSSSGRWRRSACRRRTMLRRGRRGRSLRGETMARCAQRLLRRGHGHCQPPFWARSTASMAFLLVVDRTGCRFLPCGNAELFWCFSIYNHGHVAPFDRAIERASFTCLFGNLMSPHTTPCGICHRP